MGGESPTRQSAMATARGRWTVGGESMEKKPIAFVLQASYDVQAGSLHHVRTQDRGPAGARMSHNVPECPTMSHNVPPERAEWDIRTERQRLKRQRLTGFQCPKMSHNVPQCPTFGKNGPGSGGFQVQSSRLGSSDEMRRNVTVNPTKPDETRRNPTLCEKAGLERVL